MLVALATLVAAMVFLPGNGLSMSLSRQAIARGDITILPKPTPTATRRRAVAGLLAPLVGALRPAAAFENGIPDMELYRNRTKHPGTPPVALGPRSNGKLASCSEGGLNCFSTSGDEAHLLPVRWNKPKDGGGAVDMMGDLLDSVRAYPPGQAKIDRGGFSIIAAKPDYLYVQFESMKHGFIDDVEFAMTDNSGMQVRSASRLGELDLGVNAKRLNWIAAQLRAKGWTAPAITKEEYPDYFSLIFFTYDDYIRSVLYPEYCPVPTQPLNCFDPPIK